MMILMPRILMLPISYTKDQNVEKYKYESKIGSGIFGPAYEKSDWTRQFNKESQNSFW